VTPVDCTCDGGAVDNGICPECLGWAEVLVLSPDEERELAVELLAARRN
jgi:hypothetical protein